MTTRPADVDVLIAAVNQAVGELLAIEVPHWLYIDKELCAVPSSARGHQGIQRCSAEFFKGAECHCGAEVIDRPIRAATATLLEALAEVVRLRDAAAPKAGG